VFERSSSRRGRNDNGVVEDAIVCVEAFEDSEKVGDGGRVSGRLKEREKAEEEAEEGWWGSLEVD
jgi:hypothetical protein